MRMFIFAALVPIMAAPAAAQACEASVSGKAGEVSVVRQAGDAAGPVLVSWAVERREGVGEETDHFSRPGLLLDTGMSMVPSAVNVMISRYSDPDIGRAPPLSEVRVRATPKGAAAVEWKASDAAKGHAALAKQLREAWPDELVIELRLADGSVAASSTFDLSMRADAEALAREAAAKAAETCR
jgi:hypothetical protein